MAISVSVNIDNSKIDGYLAVDKMLSEKEIIEGCKRGKRKAQQELYNRYCGSMLGVAMRYSRNVSEAEDALQEAFIRIYKYIKTFEGQREGSLSAWIKTIVVNTTLSYNRNNKKHQLTEDVDDVPIGFEDEGYFFDEEERETQDMQQRILNALQKLPAGYRTVFNLYVMEGYTHKEIAEILEISENTSKSQLSKARRFLKKLLGMEEKVKN